MRQLGTEEKAALLLPVADDDDDEEFDNSPATIPHDHFPVITKRPRTYEQSRAGAHPVLCFTLILCAFILGCVSGVIIMVYRISQDTEQRSHSSSAPAMMNADPSIQMKLFQLIKKIDFVNFENANTNEIDRANVLFTQWKSRSPELSHAKKFSYEFDLSKPISSQQWSGMELIHEKLAKTDRFPTKDFVSFSSLIRSGTLESKEIYYVNYGREEDFAYLFRFRIAMRDMKQSIVFMRRQSNIISQIEQIRQAIHYGFGGLVLFDDQENQQITTTNDRYAFFQEWARYPTVEGKEETISDEKIFLLLLFRSRKIS